MDTIKHFYARHSLAINIAINVLLVGLCIVSYAILVTLYLTQGLGLRSLRHRDEGILPPTVAVPLLDVLLTGATSALLTRSVEHSLWTNLVYGTPGSNHPAKFTDEESYQRAQWSVSPFVRLLYLITGKSWLLRISGVLLFGTALLNPILLYGVSSVLTPEVTTETIASNDHEFAGFIDGQQQVDLFVSTDQAMIVASLAAVQNLGVPATRFCSDPSCVLLSHASALQAECNVRQVWRPSLEYKGSPTVFCSAYNEDLCVSQGRIPWADNSYNFTAGPSTACNQLRNNIKGHTSVCPPGDFAVVIGAWVNFDGDDDGPGHTTHSIDCQVHHGAIVIEQLGGGVPFSNRTSFTISTSPLVSENIPEPDWSYINLVSLWQEKYAYQAHRSRRYPSPFDFEFAGNTSDQANPFARFLLGSEHKQQHDGDPWATFTNDTDRVARAMERVFDVATLIAFSRAPAAASLEVTTTRRIDTWTYDMRVIPILAVPLLATILVLCKHWRVRSDEIVIGYNPLVIARRAEELLARSTHAKALGGSADSDALSTSRGAYSAVELQPPLYEREGARSGSGVAEPAISGYVGMAGIDRTTGNGLFTRRD